MIYAPELWRAAFKLQLFPIILAYVLEKQRRGMRTVVKQLPLLVVRAYERSKTKVRLAINHLQE